MFTIKYLFRIIIAASVVALWSCAHSAEDDGLGHHHHEHEHAEHEHDGHDHEDEHDHEEEAHAGDVIHLEPEQAKKFGVECDTVSLKPFANVVKVTGQILPSASGQGVISSKSAGIIHLTKGVVEGKNIAQGSSIGYISAKGISGGDANVAARVALESAKRELDRVTPLHNDGIVSTKEYNEVKRIYEQAAAAYSGSKAGSSATSPISGVITRLLVKEGEYVELGQQLAIVSKSSSLTLRADVPEKYAYFVPLIKSANIRPSSSDAILSLSEMNGLLVSTSAGVSQGGYIPVHFSFNNNGQVAAGSFVEVYLLGEDSSSVISLPKDAISEQQGKFYAYVRLDEDCYEKRLVGIGMDNGKEVEIKSGLNVGETVVSHGGVILHLAESSGAVPEGHSHNH